MSQVTDRQDIETTIRRWWNQYVGPGGPWGVPVMNSNLGDIYYLIWATQGPQFVYIDILAKQGGDRVAAAWAKGIPSLDWGNAAWWLNKASVDDPATWAPAQRKAGQNWFDVLFGLVSDIHKKVVV